MLTADRGLFSHPKRDLNLAAIAPGTYSDEIKRAFPFQKSPSIVNHLTPNNKGFGTAIRDTHFGKYNEGNKDIYTKGLK